MDKYDKAIEYLTKNPHEIFTAWHSLDHTGHCLFQSATKSGRYEKLPNGRSGMCLTAIRACWGVAATSEWTDRIREDRRIPDDPHKVEVKHLTLFAEIQRELDHEFQRST